MTAARLTKLLDQIDIERIAGLAQLAKRDGALWVYSDTCNTVFCGYVVDKVIVSWLLASAGDADSAKRMAQQMAGALEAGYRAAVAQHRAWSKAARH
jgi:thiazole synthase ThiGH ThiG subunit